MSNIANLSSLSLAALVALHNTAVDDYAPEGVTAVDKFKSKAKAIEAIEAMCAAGNLAVAFDGGEAIIIDATPTAPQGEGEGEGDTPTIGEGDETPSDDGEGDETPSDDGEGDDGEGDDDGDDGVTVGDGKGAVAPSGFVYASDDWKRAMPRGTPEREAYRAARKRAARMARKAKEKAKAAALDALLANVGDDE